MRKKIRKEKQNTIIPINTSSPVERIVVLGDDLLRAVNNTIMKKAGSSDIRTIS
jgi:hypothetical protein